LQLSTFNDGGSTPFAFDFNVDWGDGTTSQNITSTIKHYHEVETLLGIKNWSLLSNGELKNGKV
jgi:hypothetical protein